MLVNAFCLSRKCKGYNKSQIGSIYFSSSLAEFTWLSAVNSSTVRSNIHGDGLSTLNLDKNGPIKWHKNRYCSSLRITGVRRSLTNLKLDWRVRKVLSKVPCLMLRLGAYWGMAEICPTPAWCHIAWATASTYTNLFSTHELFTSVKLNMSKGDLL